jgi:hypothetical protein
MRFIHCTQIFLDHFFALFAVGVTNGLANGLNRFVTGKDVRDGKEARLHDGVHARSHAGVARHLVGVDDVEPCFLLD